MISVPLEGDWDSDFNETDSSNVFWNSVCSPAWLEPTPTKTPMKTMTATMEIATIAAFFTNLIHHTRN